MQVQPPSSTRQERDILQWSGVTYDHRQFPSCVRLYPDLLTESEEEQIIRILNPQYPQAPKETKVTPSEKVSLLQKQMISQWGTFMSELTGLKKYEAAPLYHFRLAFQILDPKNQINWRSDGLIVMINLGADGSLLFRNKHEPIQKEWSIAIPRRSLLVIKDPFLDYERYTQSSPHFRYVLIWALSTQSSKYAYDIPATLDDCVMSTEIQLDRDINNQPLVSSEQIRRWKRLYSETHILQSLQAQSYSFPYLKYAMESRPDYSVSSFMTRLRELDTITRLDRREYRSIPTITNKNLDLFPYTFAFTSPPSTKETRWCTVVSLPTDALQLDAITNYYTEEARMQTITGKGMGSSISRVSPFDWWYSDWRQGLYRQMIQQEQSIYTQSLHHTIQQFVMSSPLFGVSLALHIMRILLHDHPSPEILDISAGWGDRLIASFVMGAKRYIGYDPNTRLIRGHRDIIEELRSERSQEAESHYYDIRCEPFETSGIHLEKGEFDMIWASPPIIGEELYSFEKTQSSAAYSEYTEWLISFLFCSLHKAWTVLRVGGQMAIHVVDRPTMNNVCTLTLLFVQAYLPGAFYRGVICHQPREELEQVTSDQRRVPIWVFEKRSKDNTRAVAESEARLRKYYRATYLQIQQADWYERKQRDRLSTPSPKMKI